VRVMGVHEGRSGVGSKASECCMECMKGPVLVGRLADAGPLTERSPMAESGGGLIPRGRMQVCNSVAGVRQNNGKRVHTSCENNQYSDSESESSNRSETSSSYCKLEEQEVHLRDSEEGLEGEWSHVESIIESLPAELTVEQRRKAIALIKRNADVFSRHDMDLGRTDLVECTIDTGNSRPIAQPLRRHARAHLDIIDDSVDKMLRAGIIEPSTSPWSSNVVLVPKAGDAGYRITIDYRRLNSETVRQVWPLARVSDCLDALSGSTYFGVVDVSHSFFQVALNDPKDRDKTAFLTRKGQFRFTALPMGCRNSTSVFSRLMSMILRGLNWVACLCYVDDCLIMGRSFEEACINTQAVLDRFRQANVKLKASKTKLFQLKVNFLGHVVSREGIETDRVKIACVQAQTFPRTIQELRSYMGLCNYYRSFCPSFASVVAPLTECLRKGAVLEWTECRQRAFDETKRLLTSAPILTMPRDYCSDCEVTGCCGYVMDVDSSGYAAGAVLQQWQDGKLRVIEYASRTYDAAQRSYCVTRKEVAALIFGLRYFKTYLHGHITEIVRSQ